MKQRSQLGLVGCCMPSKRHCNWEDIGGQQPCFEIELAASINLRGRGGDSRHDDDNDIQPNRNIS
jgi:hypothetical protein